MAIEAAVSSQVTINAVNLSAFLVSDELATEIAAQESTNMGSNANQEFVPGLVGRSFTVEMRQDYAPGGPDATLSGLIRQTVPVTTKYTSAATSTSNPLYSFNAFITSYSPIAASIGEVPTASVTFQVTGAVTRATV